MAEYQIEIGFTLHGRPRDVDLLETFGNELEEIAGEFGPATAIEGDRYVALMTMEAETPLVAGKQGWDVVLEALQRALAVTGDELDSSNLDRYLSRLHIDESEPVLA